MRRNVGCGRACVNNGSARARRGESAWHAKSALLPSGKRILRKKNGGGAEHSTPSQTPLHRISRLKFEPDLFQFSSLTARRQRSEQKALWPWAQSSTLARLPLARALRSRSAPTSGSLAKRPGQRARGRTPPALQQTANANRRAATLCGMALRHPETASTREISGRHARYTPHPLYIHSPRAPPELQQPISSARATPAAKPPSSAL